MGRRIAQVMGRRMGRRMVGSGAKRAGLPRPWCGCGSRVRRWPGRSAQDAGTVTRTSRGSVAPFAVRNNLRSAPQLSAARPAALAGDHPDGDGVAGVPVGMAHLVIAAVHNGGGELGQSIDATVRGAKCCLGAFLLALVGLPQWLVSQRKLDHVRLQRN